MKPATSAALSLVALAGSVIAVSAQTAKPAVTHRAAAKPAAKFGGCVTVPTLSPKIPALPADASCPKALYTLTRKPEVSLDYVSPLVSPELRALLDQKPITLSLVYVDTKIGTGELAKPGKWYTVHYTGYLTDGTKFDSSLDRKEPISFPYGQHRVIQGWDTGFEGMRVGGKRRLYVPYPLAYGEQGHPPVIPAKSELVFDVEFVAQSDTQPAPKPSPAPATKPEAAKPATPSPAGASAPPPTNSSTPATSTAPASPEKK